MKYRSSESVIRIMGEMREITLHEFISESGIRGNPIEPPTFTDLIVSTSLQCFRIFEGFPAGLYLVMGIRR